MKGIKMPEKKYTKRLSVCLRYWRYCNNNCSFCFERSEQFKDIMDEMPSVDAILKNDAVAKSLMAKDKYQRYTFKILGGELFAITDKSIITALADSVQFYCNAIADAIEQYPDDANIQEPFVFASNMLYDDPTAMYTCFDRIAENSQRYSKMKISMMSSYDLYGRFSNEDAIMKFFNNYTTVSARYKDIISPVASFILSKQNMQAIVSQKKCLELDVFNEIYNRGYPMDIQLLYNDSKLCQFKYSKEDLINFAKVMKERYPRVLKTLFNFGRLYNKMISDRYTVQNGRVFQEQDIFNTNMAQQKCLLCKDMHKCRNTFHEVEYNVTKCDIQYFLPTGTTFDFY